MIWPFSRKQEKLDYNVVVKSEGRGGTTYYEENGSILPFFWEISMVGITIYVPTEAEWYSFCEEHNAEWAKEIRGEVLQRMAEGTRKKRYRKGKIEIGESWIEVFSSKGRM